MVEILEIYGVEYLLIECVVILVIVDKIIEWIDWWKYYISINNGMFDNNLFFGNKFGGLMIILEKLFGVVVKLGIFGLNGVF